jgi:hypothetical protein
VRAYDRIKADEMMDAEVTNRAERVQLERTIDSHIRMQILNNAVADVTVGAAVPQLTFQKQTIIRIVESKSWLKDSFVIVKETFFVNRSLVKWFKATTD